MNLTITDRRTAGKLLYSEHWDHLISLGQNKPGGVNKPKRVLRLTFDDIEEESIASIMAGYVPPSDEDIRRIVDFARHIKAGDRVLLHCAQGISRSTAAAMIVLMVHGMTHFDALNEVRRIRPCARPNTLMLAIYRGMT